jgi:hypothetical protein
LKTEIHAELYLWNKNADAMVRVLERIESLAVCPRSLLKKHEARREELRAAVNWDLLEVLLTQEQADEARFQQLAALRRKAGTETKHLH